MYNLKLNLNAEKRSETNSRYSGQVVQDKPAAILSPVTLANY